MAELKAGVMGWPIEQSLSPKLHGFWLKQYGIAGSYEKIPVKPDELGDALKDLGAKGFRGVNLTMPLKEDALKFCDQADETAKRIGAINTVVVREDGTLEGRNTDIYGFKQNLLSANYNHDGKPAVLLGAGGAARAGVAALLELGVKDIRIVNRTVDRAERIAEIFGSNVKVFSWDTLSAALDGAGLLANATSLGMNNQKPLDISLEGLATDALVTDMVNSPLETGLLKQAKARGNPALDGLGMLLHQARPAFHAFFGKDPEVSEELRRFVLSPIG